MCFAVVFALAFVGWNASSRAQSVAGAGQPLIKIADSQLSTPPVVIAYGDMRFTDPSDTEVSNPKVRRWLIARIAEEKPDALLLGGDVPMRGGVANDYEVYNTETAPWRAAAIFVIPALGNHELYFSEKQKWCLYDQPCLDNWWKTFPKLHGLRWYSVQLGSRMVVVNLDSNLSLEPGSDQIKWLRSQLAGLAPTVRFVFINLHHPPVADARPNRAAAGAPCNDDDSPRCNEVAFADFLKTAPEAKKVRIVVTANHVHNYERFLRDGIVYLVAGGGGAKQDPVIRGTDDLYQGPTLPNYHYVKFVLREDQIDAEMIRVSDPSGAAPTWETKDRFQVK